MMSRRWTSVDVSLSSLRRPCEALPWRNRGIKEELTALFQPVPEGSIGFGEELPGANPQGNTLEKAWNKISGNDSAHLESNRALAEALCNKTVIREPLFPSREANQSDSEHRESYVTQTILVQKISEVPAS